jgi:NTE family protein
LLEEEEPSKDWARHGVRVSPLLDNQIRGFRKRQLIDSFSTNARKGAYWGIRTDISAYQLENALPCPYDRVIELGRTPARLQRLDDSTQERLINWGYGVCDAAIRKFVDPQIARPTGFPYPAVGV